MTKEVTVTMSDERARNLKSAIDARRAEMAQRRAELRHGRKAGSRSVAELSDDEDIDTDLASCVKASIKFTTEELSDG